MSFRFRRSYRGDLQAVILDWAGTAVDFGSFAPTAVFIRLFERRGVPITTNHARRGMGLMKKDHLRSIFAQPEVAQRWQERYGVQPAETDIDAMYEEFVPMQIECIADYADPIPGLLETVADLRARGLKIGTTTGYTRPMMEALLPEAASRGYVPDAWITPSDVPAGRPYPWMCYQIATQLQVFPMEAVVKVGDTVPDIEEGLNAGAWTVGLALSGNFVGLTLEEFRTLSEDEVTGKRAAAMIQLFQAGAHYVVDTIAELPAALEQIQARLRKGKRP